jgi:hypothetical protein
MYVSSSQKDEARETERFKVERVTLLFVALVALLNGIQSYESVKSAEATREANRITRDQFTKDERPYLILHKVVPEPIEGGKEITAEVFGVNYGKSPAVHALGVGGVFFGPQALTEAYGFFDRMGNTRLTPNDHRSEFTVPPGVSATEASDGGGFTSLHTNVVITQEQADWLSRNDFSVVFANRMQYQDIGGNVYQTDTCMTRLASGAIAQCPKHNDIQ